VHEFDEASAYDHMW